MLCHVSFFVHLQETVNSGVLLDMTRDGCNVEGNVTVWVLTFI